MWEMLTPILWFAALGGIFGLVLSIASKVFAVKVDERIPLITECLPGANCGGCGYTGCAAYAEAIAKGEADVNRCSAGGSEVSRRVAEVMGVEAGETVRKRAQVMCSGTHEHTIKKYVYEGAHDCVSAAKLGGGDKLCPNGCIGLGTCVSACKFNAIKIVDGIAAVDYRLCTGCGQCAAKCPKNIIRIIPFDSAHWVGCNSRDKGAAVRKYCDVGCFGCKMCEKVCEAGAIKVEDNIAAIDYSKCTDCGKCVEKCPRKIIWSCKVQGENGLVISRVKIVENSEIT
jgi:electron transport complex protein RnfB